MNPWSRLRLLVLAALLALVPLLGGAGDPIPPRTGEAVIVAEDAIQPQVAIDGKGGIHVVFIRGGNIEVASSTDGGKTFGEPTTAIDARGAARGGRQRGPRIGTDAEGRIYVSSPICFDAEELKKRFPAPELFLATSTDGGKSFGGPVQVNEVDKKAAEGLHWMAVSASGEVHLAWLDNRTPKTTALFYARATEAGSKIGKNVSIGSPLCECCAPGLGANEKGSLFVSFREGGKKASREIFLLGSRDGGGSFGRPVQVNRSPSRLGGCPMDAPAVAVSREGDRVAVAWMDARRDGRDKDVYWAISRDGRFEKDALLSGESAGYQGHPALAFDEEGALHAVWEDERSKPSRIYRRSSSDERGPTAVSRPSEGEASFPGLACRGDLVAIVYETNREGRDRCVCRVFSTPSR